MSEAERLVSSSQRLSYQAPSGSSEVTGLRPSLPSSSAEEGIARSRIELINPGLVRSTQVDDMMVVCGATQRVSQSGMTLVKLYNLTTEPSPSFLEIVSILELQDGFWKAATLEG